MTHSDMPDPDMVVLTKSAEPTVVAEASSIEKMDETDRLSLELAKANRKTALAEAQTALARNDNAELSYRYVVLQIYMKYGLNEKDAITESGEIRRGGAAQAEQKV